MSRSYRLFIVALVGWLTLYQPICEAKGSNSSTEHQSAKRPEIESLKAYDTGNHPADYKSPCDKPQYNGEESVCAGIIQAKAAEEANDISRSSFWWNRIGIGIGGLTLLAAIAAAIFAWRAVKETRRIGEAESRAYLSIISVSGRARTTGLTIEIEVRNAGQSPALNVLVQCNLYNAGNIIPKNHSAADYVGATDIKKLVPLYFREGEYSIAAYALFDIQTGYIDVFKKDQFIKGSYGGLPRKWKANEATSLVQTQHIIGALDAGLPTPTSQP